MDHMIPQPIVLFCPSCSLQHIDRGEWATTRVHSKHLCEECGYTWRPSFQATIGVEKLDDVEELKALLREARDYINDLRIELLLVPARLTMEEAMGDPSDVVYNDVRVPFSSLTSPHEITQAALLDLQKRLQKIKDDERAKKPRWAR